jgi:hypothetical protein
MNPLFYDLSQKAEDITDQLYSRKLSGESWQDIFRQKYGELIVEECVKVSNFSHESDMYPGAVIKEHFGMEEKK